MKKKTMLAIFAIVGIIVATVAVTYAIFTYSANGTTNNTITVGSITFQYNENTLKGSGINITDASPVQSNSTASQSSSYFEFTINGSTPDNAVLPFTVTAKRSSTSDATIGDIVDMYLTEVISGVETPITQVVENTYPKYNGLSNYNGSDTSEKIIYNATIPVSTTVSRKFRLRMWVDQNANLQGSSEMQTKYYCGETDVTAAVNAAAAQEQSYTCDGGLSPSVTRSLASSYNGHEFSITVNVYSQGQPVTNQNSGS